MRELEWVWVLIVPAGARKLKLLRAHALAAEWPLTMGLTAAPVWHSAVAQSAVLAAELAAEISIG